jgi:hypothetical protein
VHGTIQHYSDVQQTIIIFSVLIVTPIQLIMTSMKGRREQILVLHAILEHGSDVTIVNTRFLIRRAAVAIFVLTMTCTCFVLPAFPAISITIVTVMFMKSRSRRRLTHAQRAIQNIDATVNCHNAGPRTTPLSLSIVEYQRRWAYFVHTTFLTLFSTILLTIQNHPCPILCRGNSSTPSHQCRLDQFELYNRRSEELCQMRTRQYRILRRLGGVSRG